jgi:hypothetical protein
MTHAHDPEIEDAAASDRDQWIAALLAPADVREEELRMRPHPPPWDTTARDVAAPPAAMAPNPTAATSAATLLRRPTVDRIADKEQRMISDGPPESAAYASSSFAIRIASTSSSPRR